MTQKKPPPLARSSKLDLASGCLSRDFGVKTINCGEKKEKVSVSDNNNRLIPSSVSSLCALKKLQRKKFLSPFTLI